MPALSCSAGELTRPTRVGARSGPWPSRVLPFDAAPTRLIQAFLGHADTVLLTKFPMMLQSETIPSLKIARSKAYSPA
jgi:hypothetical protein